MPTVQWTKKPGHCIVLDIHHIGEAPTLQTTAKLKTPWYSIAIKQLKSPFPEACAPPKQGRSTTNDPYHGSVPAHWTCSFLSRVVRVIESTA